MIFMKKFLLLLLGVTFLCVNNSNAQNNNPQGGTQVILRLHNGGKTNGNNQGGTGHHAPIQVNASAYLSNGYIYVDATCYSGMTLDVYVEDEDGITYSYTTHDASSSFAVDVTSLSSGTYYLRITSDDLSYELIGEFEIE